MALQRARGREQPVRAWGDNRGRTAPLVAMGLRGLLLAAASASGIRTQSLSPPFRGWAFPFNASIASNATPAVASSWMYPQEASLNLMPTGQPLWDPAVPTLSWSYCWDAPPAKGTFTNGSFASTRDFFKNETTKRVGTPTVSGGRFVGAGLDECNLHNARTADEREAAAAGFRAARLALPNMFLAAWGCNTGDELFASLMKDGTFDLAMIEGYTYCPGCGDWPKSGECCSNTGSVRSYFSRLDYAKSQGFLNRTVFCFGFILGRSTINPTGWTAESLEAAMMEVKTAYPELGGVLMYGHPPRKGWPNATNSSDATSDAATTELIRAASLLMQKHWPTKTDV